MTLTMSANKYYLCEFHEQHGEFEYGHYHVYSKKFLDENKININDVHKDDVKLLNHFFGDIDKDDEDEGSYWTFGRLVSYKGWEEIDQSELKILEKGGVYCD